MRSDVVREGRERLTPLVWPQVSVFLPLKMVVSGSVTLLRPAPGMMPPWMPRAVPLPPASPVATAILLWAATRGEAARTAVKTVEKLGICILRAGCVVFAGASGKKKKGSKSLSYDVWNGN